MHTCIAQSDKFGDSVINDVTKSFAHFAPADEIGIEHSAILKYGVSLVECVIIRMGTRRMRFGSDFLQPHMDGSCYLVAQLHELICDILTRPNLPSPVQGICCSFLECVTGLQVPTFTWQVLRRLYSHGALVIKASILQIARGNDVIPDDDIARDLMSLTDIDRGGELLFDAVMQHYIMERHMMLVELLEPWTRGRNDSLARSDAFRRMVMYVRAQESHIYETR
jgi:hypothetical protein